MTLNLDRSTWRRVRFGDIIANVTDRVDDPSTAGVDRYVGLEHLDPGSMTVNRWGTPDQVEATKLRFRAGDVIFGRRRAYQRKVSRADFEGICSAHAMVLRAKPGLVDPDFLPVFLNSDVFLDRAVQISVGSLSPTVNWKTLAVQEFDFPPIDDQRRIADLLWATEHAARAHTRCAQVGTQVVAARVDRLMQDGLGPERKLGELLRACQYGSSTRAGADGTYPMLRMTNLRDGRIVIDGLTYVDLSDRDFHTYRLDPGDVLFNQTTAMNSSGGQRCSISTESMSSPHT
jgi:type I restriction enzyme, S subunit